jgi:hypothetical protein
MVLTSEKEYITKAVYDIEAEIKIEDNKFPLDVETIKNPNEAYRIATLLKRGGLEPKISQFIFFERDDGFLSDEEPIRREISLEYLERICQEKEQLPVKTYRKVIPLNLHGADEGD